MLSLRLARIEDCRALVELADLSNAGLARTGLTALAGPGEDWISAGIRLFSSEASEFSYRNTFVAEWSGEIAGMRMFCVQPDEMQTPDLADFPPSDHCFAVLRAKVPGHLYLANIAVFPRFRGRGIGRALIDATLAAATRIGITRVAAVVHEGNVPVLAHYARRGLVEIARHKVLEHPVYAPESDWILLAGDVQRAAEQPDERREAVHG